MRYRKLNYCRKSNIVNFCNIFFFVFFHDFGSSLGTIAILSELVKVRSGRQTCEIVYFKFSWKYVLRHCMLSESDEISYILMCSRKFINLSLLGMPQILNCLLH